MDFVTAWKASSIVLTGAFGVLGLLTEFKNEDKTKITRWGYVSLAGIVISTALGTAAQLRESEDNSSKALKLAQNTDNTLNEVQRLLSPLDEPVIDLTFQVPCKEKLHAQFCSSARAASWDVIDFHVTADKLWKVWPSKENMLGIFELMIFRDAKTAQSFVKRDFGSNPEADPRKGRRGDLAFEFTATSLGKEHNLVFINPVETEDIYVNLIDYKLSRDDFRTNDGVLVSTSDLVGATVVLEMPISSGWDNRMKSLESFSMSFKNGRRVVPNAIEKLKIGDYPAYRFTLKEE
jgi:hypothetical protein